MKSKAFVGLRFKGLRSLQRGHQSNTEFQLIELVIEKVEFIFVISTVHEYEIYVLY